jgi:hypothetical protein
LAAADLTYDRGLTALWSPREGTDIAWELVAGEGLNAASGNRQFDGDDAKSTMFRVSQDIGPVRLGAFAYRGYETEAGARNTISMWGPDATVPLGSFGEVNASYVRRVDRDPFFGTCSVADPCPGNATVPFGTTVNPFEAVPGPGQRAGFFTALYNWVDSDRPVVSLRLGEQNVGDGYVSRYRTAAAGAHYMYRRNVRMMGEAGWDFEREQVRLVLGTMLAF